MRILPHPFAFIAIENGESPAGREASLLALFEEPGYTWTFQGAQTNEDHTKTFSFLAEISFGSHGYDSLNFKVTTYPENLITPREPFQKLQLETTRHRAGHDGLCIIKYSCVAGQAAKVQIRFSFGSDLVVPALGWPQAMSINQTNTGGWKRFDGTKTGPEGDLPHGDAIFFAMAKLALSIIEDGKGFKIAASLVDDHHLLTALRTMMNDAR